MKNIRTLSIALVLAAGTVPALAGFIFNFDETGSGQININNTGFQTFNGSLITDPSSNLGSVLAWNFAGFGVTFGEGDVFIADPGGGTSDLLRFTDSAAGKTAGAGNIMIFYSGDKGGGLLADTGLPISGSTLSVTEAANAH